MTPFRLCSPPLLGALVVLGTLFGCQTRTTAPLVGVRALVSADYLAKQRAVEKAPRTYAFMKGRMFGLDRALEKVDFDVIARPLVADLATRNFTPATNSAPDMVILVNWGVTKGRASIGESSFFDPERLRAADEALEDARARQPAEIAAGNPMARGMVAEAEANWRSELIAASTALSMDYSSSEVVDLLGIRDILSASIAPPDVAAVAELLEEDRYVLGLVAYDGEAFRQKRKQVLWTTRMSIPTRSLSFENAVAQMSLVAADVNGTQPARMVMKPAAPRPAALPAQKYLLLGTVQ